MGFLVKALLLLVAVGLIYAWIRRAMVSGSRMKPSEARALLDVPPNATAEEVRAAHRKIIARVHPDAGGSAGLATRVNAARDILLEELKRRD